MRPTASGARSLSASATWTDMSKPLNLDLQAVVCIDNDGYPASLELHKIYRALPDADAAAHGDLRVVDESGEDYLFPASSFAPVQVPGSVRTSLLRLPTQTDSTSAQSPQGDPTAR